MKRMSTVLVTSMALTAVASCGGGTDTTDTGEPASHEMATDESEHGTITVRIEEVDGVFIEGFEVGLRFETPDGEVIASTLWTDFVQSLGVESIEAYYGSVLEQAVPAGTVVVLASANVGAGPPPEVPDLAGDLRCRLVVDVPESGRVDVEVTFGDPDDCLHQV
jgi:hypothetical protein